MLGLLGWYYRNHAHSKKSDSVKCDSLLMIVFFLAEREEIERLLRCW